MHPLVGDLAGFTDDELFLKINELTSKMHRAYRMGYGDAVQQLQMILEDYRFEYQRRQDKIMEEIAGKNGDFKDYINIG